MKKNKNPFFSKQDLPTLSEINTIYDACFKNSFLFSFCVVDRLINVEEIRNVINTIFTIEMKNDEETEISISKLLTSIAVVEIIVTENNDQSFITFISSVCKNIGAKITIKEKKTTNAFFKEMFKKIDLSSVLLSFVLVFEILAVFVSNHILKDWNLQSISNLILYILINVLLFVVSFLIMKRRIINFLLAFFAYLLTYLISLFMVWVMFVDKTSEINPFSYDNLLLSLLVVAVLFSSSLSLLIKK